MTIPIISRPQSAVLLLSLVLLLTTAFAIAAATPGSANTSDRHTQLFKEYRCQRPLSAMNAFSDVAKTPKELNCDFGYMDVLGAAVGLRCEEAPGADTSCNATLRVRFRRRADAAQRFATHTGTSEDLFLGPNASALSADAAAASGKETWVHRKPDPWRFSVKLRSRTHASTVHYKGEDGYSMCCDALEGASCAWENTTAITLDGAVGTETETEAPPPLRQIIERCPLPLPGQHEGEVVMQPLATEGDDGEVFTAVVTKPLHRLYEGKWEVHMDMWRQRAVFAADADVSGEEAEQLGRIVVPWELHLQQLRSSGLMAQRTSTEVGGGGAAAAAAAEDLVVVPTSAGEEKRGTDGDL